MMLVTISGVLLTCRVLLCGLGDSDVCSLGWGFVPLRTWVCCVVVYLGGFVMFYFAWFGIAMGAPCGCWSIMW